MPSVARSRPIESVKSIGRTLCLDTDRRVAPHRPATAHGPSRSVQVSPFETRRDAETESGWRHELGRLRVNGPSATPPPAMHYDVAAAGRGHLLSPPPKHAEDRVPRTGPRRPACFSARAALRCP